MELGPIQEAWLQSLEQHPERQTTRMLGHGTPENYKACCLGELLVVACALQGKPSPFEFGSNRITDGTYTATLPESAHDLGLKNGLGGLKVLLSKEGKDYWSLSQMNDEGFTWSQIAQAVRENPDNFFTKSI